MACRAQAQAIGGTTVGSLLTVALDRLTWLCLVFRSRRCRAALL